MSCCLPLSVTPLQVYLVEGLNASSAKVNVLMTLLVRTLHPPSCHTTSCLPVAAAS